MNPVMKRVGWIAASVPLLLLSGCNDGTEIPLAKVPPVTLGPAPARKLKRVARVTSPSVLPGPTR